MGVEGVMTNMTTGTVGGPVPDAPPPEAPVAEVAPVPEPAVEKPPAPPKADRFAMLARKEQDLLRKQQAVKQQQQLLAQQHNTVLALVRQPLHRWHRLMPYQNQKEAGP